MDILIPLDDTVVELFAAMLAAIPAIIPTQNATWTYYMRFELTFRTLNTK